MARLGCDDEAADAINRDPHTTLSIRIDSQRFARAVTKKIDPRSPGHRQGIRVSLESEGLGPGGRRI